MNSTISRYKYPIIWSMSVSCFCPLTKLLKFVDHPFSSESQGISVYKRFLHTLHICAIFLVLSSGDTTQGQTTNVFSFHSLVLHLLTDLTVGIRVVLGSRNWFFNCNMAFMLWFEPHCCIQCIILHCTCQILGLLLLYVQRKIDHFVIMMRWKYGLLIYNLISLLCESLQYTNLNV